jgi:hypothetical protein
VGVAFPEFISDTLKRYSRCLGSEEFVTLVAYHLSNADRETLWDIYQRVTAGRAAGLFAKLAQSLARASSLQEVGNGGETR